jgi:energy-coupling factor transporter ATP-binding protein EcfA2
MPVVPGKPALLALDHVTVMRGERAALDDVTLRIDAGEHVCILGPNGCGKSTLIKTITRECYPLANPGSSISILGRERWNIFELRSLLGIVSPDLLASCTTDATGRDVVLSGFFSSTRIFPHHAPGEDLLAKRSAHLSPALWSMIRRHCCSMSRAMRWTSAPKCSFATRCATWLNPVWGSYWSRITSRRSSPRSSAWCYFVKVASLPTARKARFSTRSISASYSESECRSGARTDIFTCISAVLRRGRNPRGVGWSPPPTRTISRPQSRGRTNLWEAFSGGRSRARQ